MQKPGVGIGVLLIDNNKILLGKRLLKHGASTWAPPGGNLEFGESFEDCAIREVEEETGLVIQNPKIVGVTNDVFVEAGKHYVSVFLSAAYPHDQAIVNREPDKILQWKWFAIDALPKELFLSLHHLLQINPKCLETLAS